METTQLTLQLPTLDAKIVIPDNISDDDREQHSAQSEGRTSKSSQEFLEKWAGFLEGINPDEAKLDYLQEKYQ